MKYFLRHLRLNLRAYKSIPQDILNFFFSIPLFSYPWIVLSAFLICLYDPG
jgi:hypothetical protein